MRPPWVSLRRDGFSSAWSSVASVVIGIALAGLALLLALSWRGGPPAGPTEVAPMVPSPKSAAVRPDPERLVEMRDQALARAVAAPGDNEAMDTLVLMQRVLAGHRPETLRDQARAHARAIRAGGPATQQMSLQAMRVLVLANLLAATQIETEHGLRLEFGRVPEAPPPPLAPAVAREPASLAASGRAAASLTPVYFLVVSPPLLLPDAHDVAGRLASAGYAPLLRRIGDGRVQVQLGAFATHANAVRLADRVRQDGLSVSVVRGGAGTAFEPLRTTPVVIAHPSPATRVPAFAELMDRGVRLYAAGWYGPALASFRQAAQARSDSARAHLWWGRAAFKVSRFREAREALVRADDLAGDAEAGRQALGLLHLVRLAELAAGSVPQ